MTHTAEIRTLLMRTAEHFETNPQTWRRDGRERVKSFCMLRGLGRFEDPSKPFDDATKNIVLSKLSHAVTDVTGKRILQTGLAHWNDHVAADVQQVIAVLRKAATL